MYEARHYKAAKYFVIYILENGMDINRVGFSVGRKTGNRVFRHRIIRLLREFFRTHDEQMKRGYDIVIVARSSLKSFAQSGSNPIKMQDISDMMMHLLRLTRIYMNEKRG